MGAEVFRLALKENSCPAGELDVTSPYDGGIVARVETAGKLHVQQSLDTAFRLFRSRSGWLSIAERIGILERAVRLMLREKDSLAMTAVCEGGKPLLDSLFEVERAIDCVRLCILRLRSSNGDVVPTQRTPAASGYAAFTRQEPVGVVVAVGAFSEPLNIVVRQVAAAITAGCPVVVKPAIDTPLSCLRFADILRKAGLPVEWCQVIVTDDMAVADALVSDTRVSFLSFVGSSEVGWRLRSKLPPRTRCALAHGGATPAVLMHDADTESALTSICRGGFCHAGQAYASVQRVFVPRSFAQEFGTSLAARAAALTVGDPRKIDTDMGPLIRNAEVRRVHVWVCEAIAGGAKLLTGGAAIGASMYRPTVLLDPALDARVSREEVLGPVLCVYAYDDVDDVIEMANSLPFTIDAAVFTRDIDSALNFFGRVGASLVRVNDHPTFHSNEALCAGMRQCGCGASGFPGTIEQMQVRKTLILNSPAL